MLCYDLKEEGGGQGVEEIIGVGLSSVLVGVPQIDQLGKVSQEKEQNVLRQRRLWKSQVITT